MRCPRWPVQIAKAAVGIAQRLELLLVFKGVVLRLQHNARVAHSRVEKGGKTDHVHAANHKGQRGPPLLRRRSPYEIASSQEDTHEEQERHPICHATLLDGTDPARAKRSALSGYDPRR